MSKREVIKNRALAFAVKYPKQVIAAIILLAFLIGAGTYSLGRYEDSIRAALVKAWEEQRQVLKADHEETVGNILIAGDEATRQIIAKDATIERLNKQLKAEGSREYVEPQTPQELALRFCREFGHCVREFHPEHCQRIAE